MGVEGVLAALAAVRLVEEEEAAKVGPGLIAFTIVVLLGVATFFLVRSMMHHINKVPPTFDDPEPDTDAQKPSDPGGGEG